MLAEPKTSQSVSALWTNARSIHSSPNFWIGMDDFKNGDGQFQYSSSGVKVPSISGVRLVLDNSPGDEDCARLKSATDIDDHTCSTQYPSICESSLTTTTKGNDFLPFTV